MVTKIYCDYCGEKATHITYSSLNGKDACIGCYEENKRIGAIYKIKFDCLMDEMRLDEDNIGKKEIKLSKQWWIFW